MEQSDALREVATVVEMLEAAGVAVEDVTVSEGGDDGAPIDLRLRLPEDALDAATPAGEPAVESSAEEPAVESSAGEPAVESSAGEPANESSPEEPTGGTAAGQDGQSEPVRCPIGDCGATFGAEHGVKIHVAKCHGQARAHRDPERLAAVYDSHDTFPAMRDALGVDVTAQTVRRNMMKYGIHDPDGRDTDGGRTTGERAADGDDGDADTGRPTEAEDAPTAATDGGDALAEWSRGSPATESATTGGNGGAGSESEDAETDGPSVPADLAAADLGLPGDVSVGEFVAAVAEARTLFDVRRALGVDRAAAQSLLAELGLLELVHGRVADGRRRCETPRREVRQRLRERLDG